jgi:hypothetical protein
VLLWFLREQTHDSLHDPLPGNCAEVSEVWMGLDGDDANALRCGSKSELDEGQSCGPGEALQHRLQGRHFGRWLTFPYHLLA